jgi:hypothetical protein
MFCLRAKIGTQWKAKRFNKRKPGFKMKPGVKHGQLGLPFDILTNEGDEG